jgi:hypothetical protein
MLITYINWAYIVYKLESTLRRSLVYLLRVF